MGELERLFYHIRDDKDSDLFKGLEKILESRDSWWCYRCASMCMKDTRIPAVQRPEYTIKFAEVLFEKYDSSKDKDALHLLIRFVDKVSRKPAYQQYIKSKDMLLYYKEAHELYLKEEEEKRIREEERSKAALEYMRSMPHVEELTEAQKYSRLVYHAKSLEEKSMIVAAKRVPYFSYKYVKDVLKTTKMPQEVKKALVMPHVEFVFASGDENAIYKLGEFLQYKPLYKDYVEEKRKVRVRVPQE